MRESTPQNTVRTFRYGVAAAAIWLCLALAPLAAANDELPDVSARIPWKLADHDDHPKDGFRLYKRRDPSGFQAYRLEAKIGAPPALVAEAARHNILDPELVHDGMDKQILRTEGDVAWVYSYIHLPMMVSDRDVITRSEASYDPTTGVYRFDWRTSDEGPAPRRGVVRLKESTGSWVFSPAEEGHTHAVYENYTDIGGRIPAWIVNPTMNSTVMSSITDLRGTVERLLFDSSTASASTGLGHSLDTLVADSPAPF